MTELKQQLTLHSLKIESIHNIPESKNQAQVGDGALCHKMYTVVVH